MKPSNPTLYNYAFIVALQFEPGDNPLTGLFYSMDCTIKRQFVEDRATILDVLPVTWNVKTPGQYYCITIKMSRIKDLIFDFEFGSANSSKAFPVTDFPERILKLDISLNELIELKANSFQQLRNLLELSASCNVIHRLPGLAMLPNLLALDLSYNAIAEIEPFISCTQLVYLNVSHNKIQSIKELPSLANLTQLHLNSNKLYSLDGIQNLPKLYELYVHHNKITSLLPLASSLTLNILDASNNSISSLTETVQALCGLRHLSELKLRGNPVAQAKSYTTSFNQRTSVRILDNCVLKDSSDIEHLPPYQSILRQSLNNLNGESYTREKLKDSVKKTLMERLKSKQDAVESSIHHFHTKIMDLQEELIESEDTMKVEMENCIRYIDAIPQEDFLSIDPYKFQRATNQYLFTKFWEKRENGKRKPEKASFKDLTNPEEIIKAAASLLSQAPPEITRESS
ncbi:protein phosphatase 1 regulatory inhibitor subunit PPP1R7 homolog [Bufo bufo]|uniref:protein phosphatase 1 regulatory inhibitor subunit PPP1R7 homolog n=1 Tax=Bufo bufo TaxID=8384 RepID=UPI001ABDB4EC|nr:protein phosphatase 1 regulatory inhibitor subunit PPP1R7 homolog [Bufo bufo]